VGVGSDVDLMAEGVVVEMLADVEFGLPLKSIIGVRRA
jgi:hypothetical protein